MFLGQISMCKQKQDIILQICSSCDRLELYAETQIMFGRMQRQRSSTGFESLTGGRPQTLLYIYYRSSSKGFSRILSQLWQSLSLCFHPPPPPPPLAKFFLIGIQPSLGIPNHFHCDNTRTASSLPPGPGNPDSKRDQEFLITFIVTTPEQLALFLLDLAILTLNVTRNS